MLLSKWSKLQCVSQYQVLTELKQMWETKLSSLKALEPLPEPPEPQPPTLSSHLRTTSTMNAVKSTSVIPQQAAGE